MEKESLSLTTDQALASILFDLRQYPPQTQLICGVLQMIAGDDGAARQEQGRSGLWVRSAGAPAMRWLEGSELVEHVCSTLAAADLKADLLASICSRVFRARTYLEVDPVNGEARVRVETGMESFACRQCGHCCRNLNYRDEVTEEDVRRWQDAGREDILEWVGVTRRKEGRRIYQIWMIPGTRSFAEACPFLTKISTENRYRCSIHPVKPWICRNYPVSRKHALMTGCSGFDT